MKCLSIQQPWAWLIIRPDLINEEDRERAYAEGLIKDIENRSWFCSYQGPLGIHAGKKFDREGYDFVRRTYPQIKMPRPEQFQLGGIIGEVRMSGCVTKSDSGWFHGPYGHVYKYAKPLPFRPCRGQLGLFEANY